MGSTPAVVSAAESADGAEELAARVETEVQTGLAKHLLAGRRLSDAGQVLAGILTTFVFWQTASDGVAAIWLAALLASTALRALHRNRYVRHLADPRERVGRTRVDVLTSAAVWGLGAPLLVGAGEVDLALLLLIYAGLIAAATSTIVADRPAFRGFMGILLVPMVGLVVAGGMTRSEVSLLLLTLLFAPFMLSVHERAHRILREQIESRARLAASEQAVAARSAFLNALLDAAPNPIFALDGDHRITGVNPAFERVTGHSRDAALGRPIERLLENEDGHGALEPFLQGIDRGGSETAEIRVRHTDGRLVWMRLTGTASADAGVGAAVVMAEDVTSQVAAREAQEAATAAAQESTRAKSRFLASMSHEIRTPMNGVMGMIELLLDSPLDGQQREWAEVLRGSAEGLLTILNDILDVSKIEAGQLTLEIIDFELPRLLSQCLQTFTHQAAKQGTELLLDVDESVPRFVQSDPVRIRQVLTNLLSNALKFTDGGEVTLTLHADRPDEEWAEVSFSVSDTGVGIPADKLRMIFDEFTQADASTTRVYGGTGLGLAICRRLAAMMRGTLTVESEVGRGSTFTLTLPLRTARAPAGTRAVAGASLEGRRMLVIDDNAAARRIVRSLVESEGASIDEADRAVLGISLVEEGMRSAQPYDLVVLDSLMPEVDGFSVAEAIFRMPLDERPRVLMLTSAASAEEAERARSLGVRGFLEKPVSRWRLLQALALVLSPGRRDGPERRMVTRTTLEHLPSSGRILVADDSKVNQQVAGAMLRKRGYSVDVVEDGREAVDVALAGHYDVVLMDVEMPELDGIAATRLIREQRSATELPIIALTAHAIAEEQERCRSAGMNDFLSKPFRADTLYAAIERWRIREAGHDRPDPSPSGGA